MIFNKKKQQEIAYIYNMPFDISQIIKLPAEEKLRIIDELWKSIDEEQMEKNFVNEEEEESPEVIAILEERMAKIERGEMEIFSWEEVEQRLWDKLRERRKQEKNV